MSKHQPISFDVSSIIAGFSVPLSWIGYLLTSEIAVAYFFPALFGSLFSTYIRVRNDKLTQSEVGGAIIISFACALIVGPYLANLLPGEGAEPPAIFAIALMGQKAVENIVDAEIDILGLIAKIIFRGTKK